MRREADLGDAINDEFLLVDNLLPRDRDLVAIEVNGHKENLKKER